MTYRIAVFKQAANYYSKLRPKTQQKINSAMEQIMKNPLEGLHVKRLRGELEGKYRYKIGGLRIVYFVDETERTIFVEAIGSRGDIYK